jgi:hypothetical protein
MAGASRVVAYCSCSKPAIAMAKQKDKEPFPVCGDCANAMPIWTHLSSLGVTHRPVGNTMPGQHTVKKSSKEQHKRRIKVFSVKTKRKDKWG